MRKAKLGMTVKDQLTGFQGTVVARSEWLWGCVSIAVLSGEHKDGKPVEEQWFDEARIFEVKGSKKREAPAAVTGGPARPSPRR